MICIGVLIAELGITYILKAFAGIELGDVYSFAFITVFGFSYFLYLYSTKKLGGLRKALLVGFLFRVFFVVWDIYGHNIFALPSSGTDASNFYNNTVRYATGQTFWKNNAIYFFGTLAKLIGTNRLLLQFLLMLLSVYTFHITIRIMKLIGISKKSMVKALWVMALLPNYTILSSIFLRESLVTVTIALSLLFFTYWWTGRSEVFFWAAVFASFLGAIFHSGMISVALAYMCVRIEYNRNKNIYEPNVYSVIATVAFAVLFAFLFIRYKSLFFHKLEDIYELADISSGQGRGGSSYAAIAGNSSNIFNFIIFTPIRMFLFLFTPLPFQIRGLSDLIAMLFSAFFYFWVWCRSIKKMKKVRQKNYMIALILVALTVTFIFGWGSVNIGTNLRHRDKIIPVYIIMLALSFEKRYLYQPTESRS